MAEDQDKIEPSGLAPGDEVPDEERFLSTEKKYPTKEARAQALEEARNPKPQVELPHVPPFITEPKPKPEWKPVAEEALTPQRPAKEYDFVEADRRYIRENNAWATRVLERHRAEVTQRRQAVPPPAEAPKPNLFQRLGNLFRRQPK